MSNFPLVHTKFKSKVLGFRCHSPLRRRRCHRSRTLAGSGWPLGPSRETCPPATCASCGSGTWTPQNHRSEEAMTTELLFSSFFFSKSKMIQAENKLRREILYWLNNWNVFPVKCLIVSWFKKCCCRRIQMWVSDLMQSCQLHFH